MIADIAEETMSTFAEELVSTINKLLADVEEREAIHPDLAIVRELAEQLLQEVEMLQ